MLVSTAKPSSAKPAVVPLGAVLAEAPGLTKAQKKNQKRAEARKKKPTPLVTLPHEPPLDDLDGGGSVEPALSRRQSPYI